jgi:hypothetical protein
MSYIVILMSFTAISPSIGYAWTKFTSDETLLIIIYTDIYGFLNS